MHQALSRPTHLAATRTSTGNLCPRLTSIGASFWEHVTGEVGRRPAQNLVLLLQLLRPPAQLPVLRLEVTTGGRSGITAGVFTVGDLEPAGQTRLGDPEASRHLRATGHPGGQPR